MKFLKNLTLAMLFGLASLNTFATGTVDPTTVLQATAEQSDVSFQELYHQYETGEATITETDDGTVEVEFRAADGGMVLIGILDDF